MLYKPNQSISPKKEVSLCRFPKDGICEGDYCLGVGRRDKVRLDVGVQACKGINYPAAERDFGE